METSFIIEMGHDPQSWNALEEKFESVLKWQEKIENKFMAMGGAVKKAFGQDIKKNIQGVTKALQGQRSSLDALIKRYERLAKLSRKEAPARLNVPGRGLGGGRQAVPEEELTRAPGQAWFAQDPRDREEQLRRELKLQEELAFREERRRILQEQRTEAANDTRRATQRQTDELRDQTEEVSELLREERKLAKLRERSARLEQLGMTGLQKERLAKITERAAGFERDIAGGVALRETREYRKELKGIERDFGRLEKSVKRVNDAGKQTLSTFDRFGIKMSGIAATLFVFQEASQFIRAIVAPIFEAEKAVIDLRKELDFSVDTINKMYEAALRVELGGTMKLNEAIELMTRVSKETLEAEKAIEMLNLEAARLENISEGTLTNTWARFGAEIKNLLRNFNFLGRAAGRIADAFVKSRENARDFDKTAKEMGYTQQQIADNQYEITEMMRLQRRIQEIINEGAEERLNSIKAERKNWSEMTKLMQRGATEQQAFFGAIGQVPFAMRMRELNRLNDRARAFESILTPSEEEQGLGALFRAELSYQQQQKYLRPVMDVYKRYYESTGEMSAKYYNNLIERIEHAYKINKGLVDDTIADEIRAYEIRQANMKKFYSERLGLSQNTISALEKSFRDTGFMSDALIRKREVDIEAMAIRMRDAGINENEIRAAVITADLKLFEDRNKRLIKMEKEYTSETKRLSDDYIQYRTNLILMEEALMRSKGFDPLKAAQIREARLRALDEEAAAFRLSVARNYYKAVGKLADDHLLMELNSIERRRQGIVDATNDEAMANAIAQKQIRDLNERFRREDLASYRVMSAAIGKMTEEHYQHEILQAQKARDNHIKITGDKVAAEEAYHKTVERLEIQRLRESESVTAGIEAYRRQALLDTQTVAEKTFRRMGTLINGIESGIQDQIFGTLQGEFEDMNSWFENMVNNFRRTINRMIADAATAKLMERLFGASAGGTGEGILGTAVEWFLGSMSTAAGPTVATNVAGAVSGGTVSPAGFVSNLPSGQIRKFQGGGHIDENIVGVGESGRRYAFHPNETVVPDKNMGGEIHVHNYAGPDTEVQAQRRSFGIGSIERIVTDIVVKRVNTNRQFRDTMQPSYRL